ncbi:helix-turn-helix domain-containing protein [Zavarzinella formosa]|uniref:helix-turn-helix domain-containing protein n=1 Tax=Zavarzinella formosa TaxID=360055 RepID=UPI0002F40383|nr:helix-turn-helix transcriptional regulator [Zavarzinella formosa]
MAKKAEAGVRERFGFAVRSGRETLKLTQEDLAEAAGLHRTYLSDVERGRRNPSLVIIARLAAALQMPASGLFKIMEASD